MFILCLITILFRSLCSSLLLLFSLVLRSSPRLPSALSACHMASYPKVRGACEYCHRRKIRCILPLESGACHNCAATGTTCLFAPRAKAGRPRRNPSQVLQLQSPEPNEPLEEHDDSQIDQPASSDAPSDSNAQSRSLPLQAQFLFPFSRPQWGEFGSLDDHSVLSTPTHELLHNPGLHTTPISHSVAMSQFQSSGSGTLTPTTSISALTSEVDWPETVNTIAGATSPELEFDLALKLCADLEHRCRSVQDTNCLANAEAHLQALDSVCMASIQAPPSADSASRSLILAALHKALEICGALVRACSTGARTSDSALLQQLLLLRRLDVVVLFGRICFARMGQAAGRKTAEEIHANIEGLLRTEYGHWGW